MIRTEKLANQKIKKLKGKQARLARDFANEINKIISNEYEYEMNMKVKLLLCIQ